MKIDPREIAALANAQPAAPRMDMYAGIHKALRAYMSDTLLGLGRMDVDDDLEFAHTCDRVMQMLDLCRSHLHHENQFVHAAMEAREPGACAGVEAEHGEHEAAIAALADGISHLLACARPARAATAHAVYRQLALFIAHNFEHMDEEETAHNRVLWEHYSDEELVRIHDALVASIPPHEMMATARWLVPFMSPAERTALLSDMQQHAPAPVLAAVLAHVQPHLTQAEWAKLMRSLGLPPLPGLVH
ncbi:MAG: hypothetical protein EON50_13270 [Acidovorax sp.]|nr:MAG: hypothetical protein EON50_13270 [Acidovorax sp.]